ncbi:MAG TPA: hypothetical protein VHG10_02055 [Glycomyces sp.]|nr:hypothetical protein [Glycomyces sp.]
MPRILVFAAMPIIAAAALTTAGSAEPGSFALTGPYELFSGADEGSWCLNHPDSRSDGADLRGPHFALSFRCQFIQSEIPWTMHAEFETLPKLADDTEMLAVQFALSPKYQPEAEAGPVDIWIEAGTERFDLHGLPGSGDFAAVTVPNGDDAILWVEDEGRAQGLSLRTGERIDPVASYYDGIPAEADDWQIFRYEKVLVRHSHDAYRLTCAGPAEVTRHTWLPDQGWAAEGRVFIAVKLSWCDDFKDIVRWELDSEAALVVFEGGQPTAPVHWSEAPESDRERLMVTAVFEVAHDNSDVRMDFTPVGHLENLREDEDYYFTETPEATEWTFEF